MATKDSLYHDALDAIEAVIDTALVDDAEPKTTLDEIVGVLKKRFSHYTWVGIYLMDGPSELVLGPFRGKPSPHTRIPLNQGICGAAASHKETVIVPDVNADPRYLACSLETKSEIVVPIMDGTECLGEIDIDSDRANAFGVEDQGFLEVVAERIAPIVARL